MADETEVETVTRIQAVDIRDLYPSLAVEDATSRVCLLCAAKLKDKTHNLTRHLERHHPGALLQLLEQRNQASPSVLASRTRRTQQEKTAARQLVGPLEDALLSTGDAKLALARWLAQEQLPVDLIDKVDFRAFLETLNQQFDPPKSEELCALLCTLAAGQNDNTLDKLAVEMTALRATCRCSEDSSLVAVSRVVCDVVQRGEAKVRVLRAAASLFDAQTCRGDVLGKNGVLGRSFVGIVSEMQPYQTEGTMVHTPVKLFDKVVASPYITSASMIQQVEEQHDHLAEPSVHTSPNNISCIGVSASSGSLAEYILMPISSLCVVPTGVPDDLALLADDMSVVLSIVSELQRRHAGRIGILSDGSATILSNLLVRYLHQVVQLDAQNLHVFSTSNNSSGLGAQHASVIPLDIYQPADVNQAELALDAVVDLIGSEASAEFATSIVRSMGCVVLVDRSRLELHPQLTVPMDMNTVVVRELEIASVYDSRALLDDALQYIAVQAQNPQSATELRQCLMDGVGLSETLPKLQTVSETVLVERYLQVIM